jgi:putative spermidine/putrescine transport system permease protein
MNKPPLFPPYTSLVERAWFFASRSFNLLVLLFLLLPILVMIPLSFSDSSFLMYPIKGFSLRWYQNLFSSDEWIRAAKNSFIVAPAATVIATVLGTLAAVGLNKSDFRGKGILMAC